MTSPIQDQALATRMEERLQFMKFCLAGGNPDQFLRQEISEKQQLANQKASEYAKALSQRQEGAEKLIGELTEEITGINCLGEQQKQIKEIKNIASEQRQVQNTLQQKLENGNKQLLAQQKQKTELVASLNALQGQLRKAKGPTVCENDLNTAGAAVCYYISHKTTL